jgi:hypothetical protein
MVAHLVLLKPKPDLTEADRAGLLDAMRVAFTAIGEIRRVRVGRRTLIGRGYEGQMSTDFEFVCVMEFDSEVALKTYLDHPAHEELGKLFFTSAASALVYDFQIVEPDRIGELL